MKYQEPKTMIAFLKKAQEAQIKVAEINDGHCIHIDQSSHGNWQEEGYHICFDVTLFDGTDLVNSWDFNAMDDIDELNHTIEDLFFQIGRL